MGSDDEAYRSATDVRPKQSRTSVNGRFKKCCMCELRKPSVTHRSSDDNRCDECHHENMRNLRSQKKNQNKENGETAPALIPDLTEPTSIEKSNDMNDQVIENGETVIKSKVAVSSTSTSTENHIDKNNPVIINEVLTYISNKMDLLAKDTLVLICSDFYTNEVIESAKALAFKSCNSKKRLQRRQGDPKLTKKKNIEDIYDVIANCDINKLPIFVARDLQNIPPVDLTHIDVSTLTSDIRDLKKSNQQASNCDISSDLLNIKNELRMETKQEIEEMKDQLASIHALLKQTAPKSSCMTQDNNHSSTVIIDGNDEGVIEERHENSPETSWSEVVRRKNRPPSPKQVRSVTFMDNREENYTSAIGSRSNQLQGTVTNRRPSLLLGTGRSSNIAAVKKRTWSLFISRANTETTSDDIVYHVRSIMPRANVECNQLQTRYNTYKSFKLNVVCENIETLMDPNSWPEGILVRKFFTPRSNSTSRPQQKWRQQ